MSARSDLTFAGCKAARRYLLRFAPDGVHLVASRKLAYFGRVVLLFLALQVPYAWMLAAHTQMPVVDQVWRFIVVMAMLQGMAWLVHRIYIQPWRIQVRAKSLAMSKLSHAISSKL